MSNQPNEPVQNYEIVNPTLEQQVRTLLPSVAGYGGLLRSTNTVIPVVDVTTAAEGTVLPTSLQQALAFGSQTSFRINNATTALATVPGFYRIIGTASAKSIAAVDGQLYFEMTDGFSTKRIWDYIVTDNGTVNNVDVTYDFIVFVASGITLNGFTNRGETYLSGSIRQIATSDGTLVDPAGFPV